MIKVCTYFALRDTREEQDTLPKYFGAGKHSDDILCMAYQEPKTLVSASYDGDILVWNINAERVTCKLNASAECRQSWYDIHIGTVISIS